VGVVGKKGKRHPLVIYIGEPAEEEKRRCDKGSTLSTLLFETEERRKKVSSLSP